jgi:hypothetical protein
VHLLLSCTLDRPAIQVLRWSARRTRRKPNATNVHLPICLQTSATQPAAGPAVHARSNSYCTHQYHSLQPSCLLPPNRPFRRGNSNAMIFAIDHDRSPFLVLQSSRQEQMQSCQYLSAASQRLLRTSCRCGVNNAACARAGRGSRMEQTEKNGTHCPLLKPQY